MLRNGATAARHVNGRTDRFVRLLGGLVSISHRLSSTSALHCCMSKYLAASSNTNTEMSRSQGSGGAANGVGFCRPGFFLPLLTVSSRIAAQHEMRSPQNSHERCPATRTQNRPPICIASDRREREAQRVMTLLRGWNSSTSLSEHQPHLSTRTPLRCRHCIPCVKC